MAKKQPKTPKLASVPKLKAHIKVLDFDQDGAYLAWCRDNGFAATLAKTKDDLEAEAVHHANQHHLIQRNAQIEHNPVRVIKLVCEGRIEPDVIKRPGWRTFCEHIANSNTGKAHRAQLAELLSVVERRADFLFDYAVFSGQSYPYIAALIKLNDRHTSWQRPLADWRPRSHNKRRQFASLARHLLARFDVPLFMDQAWFRAEPGAQRLRDWFSHIGSGKNIRTAKMSIAMTKKTAHHFLSAPDDYSIEGAVRWGEIHSMGGDRRLVEAFLGTRKGEDFTEHKFWATVLKFFVDNPMLDRRHVGPICDYIQAQKFQRIEVFDENNLLTYVEPPQPNFAMGGRSADRLLAQVADWHRELGNIEDYANATFPLSKIKPFEQAGQTVSATGTSHTAVWVIKQLRSTQALLEEGRAMGHCVATYAKSCERGQCSIWSMRTLRKGQVERRQTVEVDRHGLIVQCRGRFNATPRRDEVRVLQAWAAHAGLSVSKYMDTDLD